MNKYKKFLLVGVTSILMAASGGLAHAQSVSEQGNQPNQPDVTVTQGAENIFGGAALGAVVSRLFGNSGKTGAWVGAVAGGIKTVYDNYQLSQKNTNQQAANQQAANQQAQQYPNNNINAQPTNNNNNNSGLLKMVAGVNGVDYKANIENLKSGAMEIQTKTIGDMLYALNSLTPETPIYVTPEEYQLLINQKQHNYSAHIIPQINIQSQYASVIEHLSRKFNMGIVQTSDGNFIIGTKYQTENLSNMTTAEAIQAIQIRNANKGVAAGQPEQFPSPSPSVVPSSVQVQNNIINQRQSANEYSPNGVNPNGGLAAKYGN